MRWFVVFLVVANLVLYFWVKQQSLPSHDASALAPPDIGRLRLLSELQGQRDKPISQTLEPSFGKTADEGESDTVLPEIVANADERSATPLSPVEAPVASHDSSGNQETSTANLQPVSTSSSPEWQTVVDPVAGEAADAMGGSSEASVEQGPSFPEGAVAEPAPEGRSGGDDKVETADVVDAAIRPELTPPSCARVGPFTAQEADMLIAHLPEHLTLYSDIVEEYTKVDAYYVMIAALPSREAGNRKMQELADAGIKDTWLFRSGEYRNAISLGLFTREASAMVHARNIEKKGFPNQVIPRTSHVEGRWLYLRNRDGGDIGLSLPLPESASVQRMACP